MKDLTYIQGALILAVTNLITGSLAFFFRIYFSRSVGAEGMGVFQLVFPLYMLLITLVSGGITTALSKIIAEYKVKRNLASIVKTIRVSFFIIGLWSIFLSIIMLLNAEYIGSVLLKDERTIPSVIICIPSVFFISLSAILRGYYFGMQRIKYPAAVDMAEKVVRLGGLIFITNIMLPHGIALACAGAMLAMTAGEFISTLLLFVRYPNKKSSALKEKSTEDSLSIIKKIISLAVPLSLGGALATIMDMISAIMVPAQLRAAGYSTTTALSLYGEVTGMVMPLISYPGIIVFSLTITLVPAITHSYVSKNKLALNKKCNDSLTIAWSMGLLATVLCISFPTELCDVIYKCPEAGRLLFWTGLGCSPHYLHVTQFAILNGLGLQKKVLSNVMFDILINMACIYLFIPIAEIGIYGYIIGFVLSGIFISRRNIKILKKHNTVHLDYTKVLLRPIIPFFCMLVVVKLTNTILMTVGFTYNMIFSGLIGILAFFISLLLNGVFSWKQVKNTLSFIK